MTNFEFGYHYKNPSVQFLFKNHIFDMISTFQTMIYKIHTPENELFVYMNGRLIFKKWMSYNTSKVFDVLAYDYNTLISIKDPSI